MLYEISHLQTGRVPKTHVQCLQPAHSSDDTTSQPVSNDDSTGVRLFPTDNDDADSDSAASVSSVVRPLSASRSRPVRATAGVPAARFAELICFSFALVFVSVFFSFVVFFAFFRPHEDLCP